MSNDFASLVNCIGNYVIFPFRFNRGMVDYPIVTFGND